MHRHRRISLRSLRLCEIVWLRVAPFPSQARALFSQRRGVRRKNPEGPFALVRKHNCAFIKSNEDGHGWCMGVSPMAFGVVRNLAPETIGETPMLQPCPFTSSWKRQSPTRHAAFVQQAL